MWKRKKYSYPHVTADNHDSVRKAATTLLADAQWDAAQAVLLFGIYELLAKQGEFNV